MATLLDVIGLLDAAEKKQLGDELKSHALGGTMSEAVITRCIAPTAIWVAARGCKTTIKRFGMGKSGKWEGGMLDGRIRQMGGSGWENPEKEGAPPQATAGQRRGGRRAAGSFGQILQRSSGE